jgi:isoleucyl-tRNA synthetase
MPGERGESVFFETWAKLPEVTAAGQPIDWAKVLEARAAALRELERLRVAGQIGASLDAEVALYGTEEWLRVLAPLGDELRFVMITSAARVAGADARPAEALPADEAGQSGLWLQVRPVPDAKCVRCWHKRPDVGTVAAHPELCARCAGNLDGPGEARRYA